MATKLEESFVRENLKGPDVFEFGCSPAKFTVSIAGDYNVTAIDLYDAEYTEGYRFIRGDILETKIDDKFDSAICLSSFEHCGIESLNYMDGNSEDLSTLHPIADRIISLIKTGGRLVITAPFGTPNIYYVDKDGNNGTSSEIKNPAWGFRTFRVEQIADMFSPLELTEAKVYGFVEGDYFEETSWRETSVNDYEKYNNKHRGLLCCVLENRSK